MKKSLLLLCSCFSCLWASAQTTDTETIATATVLPAALKVNAIPDEVRDEPVFRKNNIQMNLSSLALKNYNFSYERSLSRKISFVAGYRFMPATTLSQLPLVEKLEDRLIDKDILTQDDVNDLDDWSAANKTFTGEFRFYSGKKPGARGFYLSLYGRYTTMQVDYLYDYET